MNWGKRAHISGFQRLQGLKVRLGSYLTGRPVAKALLRFAACFGQAEFLSQSAKELLEIAPVALIKFAPEKVHIGSFCFMPLFNLGAEESNDVKRLVRALC